MLSISCVLHARSRHRFLTCASLGGLSLVERRGKICKLLDMTILRSLQSIRVYYATGYHVIILDGYFDDSRRLAFSSGSVELSMIVIAEAIPTSMAIPGVDNGFGTNSSSSDWVRHISATLSRQLLGF